VLLGAARPTVQVRKAGSAGRDACRNSYLWLYQGGRWHEGLGYVALGLATWRVAPGLSPCTSPLRFAGFVRSPAVLRDYLRLLLIHREPRYLGHNPLGGWMVVALLACAVLAGLSGALYATDRFWGDSSLYALHQAAGWSFALLVPLHVGGVIFTSLRQRENLVHAMLTGRKRAAAPNDVDTV
jgi:cytochrome b